MLTDVDWCVLHVFERDITHVTLDDFHIRDHLRQSDNDAQVIGFKHRVEHKYCEEDERNVLRRFVFDDLAGKVHLMANDGELEANPGDQ